MFDSTRLNRQLVQGFAFSLAALLPLTACQTLSSSTFINS
jgi:hypothetical protein